MYRSVSWVLGVLIFSTSLAAQTLSVSTQQISWRMLETGPLPQVTRFSITSAGPWKIAVSDRDVLGVSPAQGTGNATVTAAPVSWRRPGTYNATITVSDDQSGVQTIPVTLTVTARQSPKFSYPSGPSGPNGCTDAPEFPAGNAAVCTVPDEKPPGSFAPPALGGTYTDPNFGARVRVIGGPSSYHGYSSPSPVSATNKYALLFNEPPTDQAVVVELLTGKVVRQIPYSIFEGAMWDPRNDNYFYNFSGNTVIRYDVSNGQTTRIADYGAGATRLQGITSGGTGEITKDNWLAFFSPKDLQICALSVNASKTYCAAFPAGTNANNIDFTTMSKGVDRVSGVRYVVAVVRNGPFLIYTVNEAASRLDLAGRGPENIAMTSPGGNRDGICDSGEPCVNGSHSDTMEDSAGNQLVVVGLEEQTPCGLSYFGIQLNKGAAMGTPAEFGGGLRRMMRLFRCGSDTINGSWMDFHTGCAKAAPLCVVSTSYYPSQSRDPNDNTPLKHVSYQGEILVIRDGTEVRRLVKHRGLLLNNQGEYNYWSTARAGISADGAYVVATSNFGYSNQRRVIAVDTGLATPRLAEGNPVLNAASYEPTIAPGVLAIAFGTNLASCIQSSTYPLSTSLCGTSVKVGETNAQVFSVTPEQIAFFVPRGVVPNLPATLTVESTQGGDVVTTTATLPASAIAAAAPALFARATPGSSQNSALLFDAEWNQRAMRTGEYAIAFAVGLGATNPPVEDGLPSPLAEPLARLVSPPDIYINDVRQPIYYAGLVPGMSGVFQLVFQIDGATPVRSDFNFLWINANGVESPRLLMSLLPPA